MKSLCTILQNPIYFGFFRYEILLKLTDFHNSGSKYFSALYLTFYFILCKLYALEI